MRPDSKHDRSLKAGRARARMYLKAHLGWRRRFPLGQGNRWIGWLFWPPGRELSRRRVRLDGLSLRKAELALTKLLHRFGRAFPQVVEDADQWPTRARQLLDRLKTAIHQNGPLPADLPEAVTALPASVQLARAGL